ncbi:hypothetical protein BD779DRAFT_1496897 [Infundibulicybe gibba]|nr:hypothetical protein BD779DRAFT_1496897 [Infundibulicybe gibba]
MKVVLSLLIAKFRFAPPVSKEIVWEMNAIASPNIKGSRGLKAQLPLVISLRP